MAVAVVSGIFLSHGVPFHPARSPRQFFALVLWLLALQTVVEIGPVRTVAHDRQLPQETNSAKTDIPPQPEGSADTEESEPKQAKNSRGSIVAVPIPISSPTIGSCVVLVGGYISPFQKSDQISPPSTVGAAGLLTNDGSRGLAIGGELYLKQNTIRITSSYFRGNLNYDFYGVGQDAGESTQRLPLKQTGQFLGEFLYRISWKFFLGPRLLSGNSTIILRPTEGSTLPPPPELGVQTTLTGLGFRLNRDTRPNRFYPTEGTFSTLRLFSLPNQSAASIHFNLTGSPSTIIDAWVRNRCSPTTYLHARQPVRLRFTASASTTRTMSCVDTWRANTSIA
jgi:hypothetical protein